MTELRTKAGKRLDSAWPGTHLDRLAWHEAIVRIEYEATAAAEQRLRERIEALENRWPQSSEGWNGFEQARDWAVDLLDTPAPASPRQGEPHPECVTAYHAELTRTGQTIMRLATVQRDVADAEAYRTLLKAER